ncbi:MAG: restriction endonuclease subunit S [Clostridia bacterium]|nr:restriction endonuclease subunit S [Clostridia bacterium]
MNVAWVTSDILTDRLDCAYYDSFTMELISKLKNMPLVPMKDFVTKKRSEPPIHSSMYRDKGVMVIRSTNFGDFFCDLTQNVVYLDAKYLVDEKITEFIIKPGLIVFCLTGDVGHAFVTDSSLPKAITNRRVAQLEVVGVDSHYLCTFINTQFGKRQFDKFSTGVTQPNLRLEDSIEILIPIPSSKVQQYIGDKIRKAEELREEIRRLQQVAEETFYECTKLEPPGKTNGVNKLYTIVKPNEIGRLLGAEVYKEEYVQNQQAIKEAGEYVYLPQCYQLIVNGADNRNYTSYKVGTPYYKVASISMWGIKQEAVAYIDMDLSDVPKNQKITFGDLLITRKGSFGIAMRVTEGDVNGIISSEVFRVKLLPGWDADYIAYFLNSEYGHKQFLQYATGSTMKGISQENITELVVPKVSIVKQILIGEIVRDIKNKFLQSTNLINEAKQDVEDLIEGRFDESKVSMVS